LERIKAIGAEIFYAYKTPTYFEAAILQDVKDSGQSARQE